MRDIRKEYELAKKEYAKIGVDTDKAIETLSSIRISMHYYMKLRILS